MPPSQWIFTLLTYGVLLLLLWQGRRPERWAAAALLATQSVTPLIVHLQWGGIRIGLAAVSVALSVTLVGLAVVGRRWWLIAAAGVQLVAVASWVHQILDPSAQVWAAVTFRIIVWMELMTLAVFGVLEARFAPYARPQA